MKQNKKVYSLLLALLLVSSTVLAGCGAPTDDIGATTTTPPPAPSFSSSVMASPSHTTVPRTNQTTHSSTTRIPTTATQAPTTSSTVNPPSTTKPTNPPIQDGNPLGLEYKVNADGKTCTIISRGTFDGQMLTIPNTIDGYTVVRIGDEAFFGENLISVSLPNSLLEIENYAFCSCEQLANISIPSSVILIGLDAFSYTAYYYNDLNWNNGCLYIDDWLISAENYVGTQFTVSKNVTQIATGAFLQCDVSEIYVDNDNPVYTAHDGILYNKNMTSLVVSPSKRSTAVSIPNSVNEIESSAFFGCRNITNIEIPTSVTVIKQLTFTYCSNLKTVSLPQNLVFIGANAFNGCSNLTLIVIPNSVTTIEHNAFRDCSKLSTVVLPERCTYIGLTAFCNTGITSITLPSEITAIEEDTFSYCSELESIVIPNKVTYIGSAFLDCTNLNTIYYEGTVNEWNSIKKGSEYRGWDDRMGYTEDYAIYTYTIHCTNGNIPVRNER